MPAAAAGQGAAEAVAAAKGAAPRKEESQGGVLAMEEEGEDQTAAARGSSPAMEVAAAWLQCQQCYSTRDRGGREGKPNPSYDTMLEISVHSFISNPRWVMCTWIDTWASMGLLAYGPHTHTPMLISKSM